MIQFLFLFRGSGSRWLTLNSALFQRFSRPHPHWCWQQLRFVHCWTNQHPSSTISLPSSSCVDSSHILNLHLSHQDHWTSVNLCHLWSTIIISPPRTTLDVGHSDVSARCSGRTYMEISLMSLHSSSSSGRRERGTLPRRNVWTVVSQPPNRKDSRPLGRRRGVSTGVTAEDLLCCLFVFKLEFHACVFAYSWV